MSMMEKLLRAQIEERGFEALQRLYITACSDTGQSRKVASLLLGLYNGDRFPFDLTDLRGLDDALFEDCMAVLRMDGRICRQEVHDYFEKGSTKFERLASEWRMTDHRLMRLELQDKVARQPIVAARLDAGAFNAKLVTYTQTPGSRRLNVTVDLTPVGEDDGTKPVRADIDFDTASSQDILTEMMDATRLAWQDGRPLDARDGERPPKWINDGQ